MKFNTAFNLASIAVVLGMLFNITIIGLVVWVAAHFIGKILVINSH